MTEITTDRTEGATLTQPTIEVDYARYDQYLEGSDLTDAEKRQFLETLWSIIVSFVDLGFGVHPVQQAFENSCEQSAEIRAFITAESADVVNSADINIDQTEATGRQSDPTKERRIK